VPAPGHRTDYRSPAGARRLNELLGIGKETLAVFGHHLTIAAAGIERDVLNLEENSEETFISSCMRSNHWRFVS